MAWLGAFLLFAVVVVGRRPLIKNINLMRLPFNNNMCVERLWSIFQFNSKLMSVTFVCIRYVRRGVETSFNILPSDVCLFQFSFFFSFLF